MIASATTFDDHPLGCTCVWCSRADTYVTNTVYVVQVPVATNTLAGLGWDVVQMAIEYEAVAASRRLMVAELPEQRLRGLVARRRDPLRHHKQRCFARRPRLSLLEQVRRR